MRGLSPVVASGGYSLLWCVGFSLRWLLLLRSTSSRCAGFSSCDSRALERRLSSCGTRAQLLHGMWDLPGPGLKLMSPALAGGFPTTAHQGSPQQCLLMHKNFLISCSPICLFFLLLPVPSMSYPRNHCEIQCCTIFALCFPLRVLGL